MERTFHHLSLDERETLALGLVQGLSLRAMARQLGRSPSTLSREVRRNGGGRRELYRASVANRGAVERSRRPRRPRKLASGWLWRYVDRGLRRGWSPEQIAGRLRADYPGDMSRHVSHETIYAVLYATTRGELRRAYMSCLRQDRKKRRPRARGEDRRGRIPNMVSIHKRPAEVEERLVPGHWEGDLVKGKANPAAIGTLVERTTRLVLLVKMEDSTAETAYRAFSRKLARVPAVLRKTLTYDQGKEMADHEQLAKAVTIRIYFADPHSPWQRGLSENTNGLIRQYFPKGTDLTPVTQRDLNRVAYLLNTRPRKILGFATPLEAFDELSSVAFGT